MHRRILIAGLSLLFSFSVAVGADTTPNVLKNLGDSDFKIVSAAAHEARHHAYREIAAKLIEILNRADISGGNTSYAWVISHSIQTLSVIGCKENQRGLEAAGSNIKRILSGTAHETKILQDAVKAQEAMKTRLLPLPSMYSAATPTSVPNVPLVKQEDAPTPVVVDPSAAPIIQLKKMAELLADASAGSEFNDLVFPTIEKNLYDDAVDLFNAKKEAPGYLYRDTELEKLLQALLRTQRSHVLLTGKAGVGKTALVELLQNGWVRGWLPFPGTNIPLILELSILDVTNPADPSQIKKRIAMAEKLAAKLNRDIFLFIDEAHVATDLTRQAIKGFLTTRSSRVHFIWSTTGSEARTFLKDPAFSRRWSEVFVPELSEAQAIHAVANAELKNWQTQHTREGVQLGGISSDAYTFANKYRRFEQPHAGNPTALKELLEGSIVYRLRELEERRKKGDALSAVEMNFTLEPEDIRRYLKFYKNKKLLPGDPEFVETFNQMWSDFRAEYPGQDGAMSELREWLRGHFSTLNPEMILSIANFGPPAAGKSYLPEILAKHFFNGATRFINAGMFSGDGSHPLNILIGSPTGTVGSEDQRGLLPSFIAANPEGGIFVFEEADYLPQAVVDFLSEAITKKGFDDGLGQYFSLENFMFVFNSNIGQELLIPSTHVTWEEYQTRKLALTQKVLVDGKPTEVVRSDKKREVFDQLKKSIGSRGRSDMDSAQQRQNGVKLNRRLKVIYSMLPSREELAQMGQAKVDAYIKEKQSEFGVTFQITPNVVDTILDLDHYQFDQGYSYVNTRLSNHLFNYLNMYLDQKNRLVDVSVDGEIFKLGRTTVHGHKLVVNTPALAAPDHYPIAVATDVNNNPWFANDVMRARIRSFPIEMAKRIRHQTKQINYLHKMLEAKILDWSTVINIAQIGMSGVGKTEFGYALADVLFGTRDAAKVISAVNTWEELQNFIRSPVGFVGNREETEFERWFMSRKSTGGVIILDEFLTFNENDPREVANRISIINKLFDLYEKRSLRFGDRTEDASAFILLTTGNSMMQFFDVIDDSPGSEQLAENLLKYISFEDIMQFFKRLGLNAPGIARLGEIFLNGPLPKNKILPIAQKDLKLKLDAALQNITSYHPVKVEIDPRVVKELVDRVSNVRLGMRLVDSALLKIITGPLKSILFEFEEAEHIEVKLVDGQIKWFMDGALIAREELEFEGEQLGHRWVKLDDHARSHTSVAQLENLEVQPKIRMTPENSYVTYVHEMGHWMTQFLLFGKSNFQSISLNPSGGSLGRVMFHLDLEHDVVGLTSMLKEVAVLAAGHRAVFNKKIFAGGSGAGVQPQEMKNRQDDVAKISGYLDSFISNGFLESYSEFSNSAKRAQLKDYLRQVTYFIADFVWQYGESTGVFKTFGETLQQKRFVGSEEIESFTKSIAKGALKDPDTLFIEALQSALPLADQAMAKHGFRDASEVGEQILSRAREEFDALKNLRHHCAATLDANP